MKRDPRHGERGHLMVGLMAMIAIMLIFSTMAFQAWEDVLHRDNEAEMIFRAEEIVRAIQRYRKDHGGVAPQKLEDLMEPGPRGQYYLRHLYLDPLVADGKWGLLHVGPGGQIIDPAALPVGGQANGLDGGASLGGLGGNASRPGSTFGDKGNQANRSGAQRGAVTGGQNRLGQPGGGLQPLGQQSNAAAGGLTGLPIAGVRTLTTKKPFRERKGFSEYSEWLFTYLDLEVQQVPGQGGPGRGGRRGQPGSPNARPGGQSGNVPGLTQPTRPGGRRRR